MSTTISKPLAPTMGYLNRFKNDRYYGMAKDCVWKGLVLKDWSTEEASLKSLREVADVMKQKMGKRFDTSIPADDAYRQWQIGNAIELCYKAISLWHRDHHYKA